MQTLIVYEETAAFRAQPREMLDISRGWRLALHRATARKARLPLALLRLRTVLLHALIEMPTAPTAALEEPRLRAVLERAGRRPLPAAAAQVLDVVLRRSRGPMAAVPWASAGPSSSRSSLTSRNGAKTMARRLGA